MTPAQFLCADGLSVPPSIKTSQLNTFVCNVKQADIMMYDGKRRKCKKNTENNVRVVFYHKQGELSCEKDFSSHITIPINMLFSIPVITTALNI